MGKGAAVSALFAYIFYRSMLAFGFMLPLCCGILIWRERRQRLKRRKRMLAQQFKEAMVILAASLSAGYAVENAMAVSLEELRLLYGEQGLIVREFSGMVQQIHKRGKTISAWTVNREEDASNMLSLGVDDVITDKPEMVQELISEDADLYDNLLLIRDAIRSFFASPDEAEQDPADEVIEDAIENPDELLNAA